MSNVTFYRIDIHGSFYTFYKFYREYHFLLFKGIDIRHSIFGSGIMEGFLKPFEEFIVKRTGTNRLWARSLALACLSTAIGDKVKFLTEKSPLQLNLFYLDVGASGLSRKTLAMRYYAKPVLMRLEKLVQEKLLLPEEFTAEGLHEYFLSSDLPTLAGVERRFPVSSSGIILQDEFSKFTKEVQGKKYMFGQFEFLSELYDGYVKSRFTRNDKYQPGVEVSVNLIAASTPAILPALPRDFFRLGLGNRILYINSGAGIVEREDSERYFLPEFETEREKYINQFADKLQDYGEICKSKPDLMPSPDAGKWLAEYEFQKKMQAQNLYVEDVLSLVYSYIDRLPVSAFKFAGLHAIDRVGELKGHLIEIDLSDAQWATGNADEHFKQFEALLELWKQLETRQRTEIRRRDPEDIKSLILTAGIKGISEEELRRKAYSRGFTSERFRECVHMLITSQEVMKETLEDTGKPGPKPTIFRAKEFKEPKWFKKREKKDEHTQN